MRMNGKLNKVKWTNSNLVVPLCVGGAHGLRVRPLRHLPHLHRPPGELEPVHLLQGLLRVLRLDELGVDSIMFRGKISSNTSG